MAMTKCRHFGGIQSYFDGERRVECRRYNSVVPRMVKTCNCRRTCKGCSIANNGRA